MRIRLRELAVAKPRWQYQQLHVLLRREGHQVNHKKARRLYREEGLAVSRRRREKQVAIARAPLQAARARTERWSMDFVGDTLSDGRGFPCFTLVDDFTRECQVVQVAHSLSAWRVVNVLERVARHSVESPYAFSFVRLGRLVARRGERRELEHHSDKEP